MSINLSVFGYPGWEADNEGNVYKNGKLIPGKVYQGYNRSHTSFPLIKRATLVCTAWHGPKPFDEAEVRHLNDIHDDDRPENLKWGTHTDNVRDSVKNGTHYTPNYEGGCAPKPSTRGFKHYKATLSDDDIREIRRLRVEGVSAVELAKTYGVHVQYIYAVVSRRKRSEVV